MAKMSMFKVFKICMEYHIDQPCIILSLYDGSAALFLFACLVNLSLKYHWLIEPKGYFFSHWRLIHGCNGKFVAWIYFVPISILQGLPSFFCAAWMNSAT